MFQSERSEAIYDWSADALIANKCNFRHWMMGGAYQMETGNGERFDIEIPTFSLDRPNQGVLLN